MKNRFTRPTALAATSIAITMLITGPAMAEKPNESGKGHHGEMHPKMMSRMDVDADKRISREEFSAQQIRIFDEMDRNGDNFIDGIERSAYRQLREDKLYDSVEQRKKANDAIDDQLPVYERPSR